MILRREGMLCFLFVAVLLALSSIVGGTELVGGPDDQCYKFPLYDQAEGVINSTYTNICLSVPPSDFPSFTKDIPETYQLVFSADGHGKENICVSVTVTNTTNHESSATQCQPQAEDDVPFCFNVRKSTLQTLYINISCYHYFPKNNSFTNNCNDIGNVKFAVALYKGCSNGRSWTYAILVFFALLVACAAVYFGVKGYLAYSRRRMYTSVDNEESPIVHSVNTRTTYVTDPNVAFVPQGSTAPPDAAMRDFMAYAPMKQ